MNAINIRENWTEILNSVTQMSPEALSISNIPRNVEAPNPQRFLQILRSFTLSWSHLALNFFFRGTGTVHR